MKNCLLRTNNIAFFKYKSGSLFLNYPKYFKDTAHLNKDAANLFSAKLTKAITGEMKNVADSSQ
jgi:hypothetical protein